MLPTSFYPNLEREINMGDWIGVHTKRRYMDGLLIGFLLGMSVSVVTCATVVGVMRK